MTDLKPKRKKKDSRAVAQKAADDAFSLYIRARDKRCVTCGSTDGLQCSHVERRGRHATRYLDSNAYAQCARCHTYHHLQSETPLRDYVLSKIGQTGMQMLYSLSRTTQKRTVEELREVARLYNTKLEAME